MNNYDQSPFYTSSQQSLELDHHSRGSSSSSSMQTQLLSPLQGSTAMDWSTQQFFGYDGQSNVSSPSFIPDLNALKTGQPAYRAPGLGPQQNYQPAALGIQAPYMSTDELQKFINQSNISTVSNTLPLTNTGWNSAFANIDISLPPPPPTLFPQQQLVNDFQTHNTLFRRSPSPLNEIEEEEISPSVQSVTSPEVSTPPRQSRRASDGSLIRPSRKGHDRRLSGSLSMEEKIRRAQATEGLNKQDKRRVQNKLAQRAFRERSKVVNKDVQSRLDYLEKLKGDQEDRIEELSEVVSRLQHENTALKAQQYGEAST